MLVLHRITMFINYIKLLILCNLKSHFLKILIIMPHKTKRLQVVEFAVKKWKIIIKNLNVKIVKNLFILHV